MRLARFSDNWNKVKTKEELLEMLKRYRGILNNSMAEYLNSLIELEFSVVKDYIDSNDRKMLSELDIYKKVAIYNIYNRAISLFNNIDAPVKITGNDEGFESLDISLKVNDEKCIKLFDFSYAEGRSWEFKIPSEYKTMRIGGINIYQTLESKELRETELNRIMDRLELLYDQKNPYPSPRKKIGGPGVQWRIEHQEEIARYENMFNELDSKKDLTDEEKVQIEVTNKVHDLILEDYGLTDESFEEKPAISLKYSTSKLQKTLVKSQPNLTCD